jgi:hypothetical protein
MARLLSTATLLVAVAMPGSISGAPTGVRTAGAHKGYASIYNPGVMGRIARKHGLPIVGCMIATPLASKDSDLGRWVTVTSLVTGERTNCRVTDVVRARDMREHLRSKHYVEFDATSGLRMCNQAYVGQKPRKACPIRVTF